jgi:hypothetical protein
MIHAGNAASGPWFTNDLCGKTMVWGTMDAGINNVIYVELHSGPKMANGTRGKTIVAGTIDRGSTVPGVFHGGKGGRCVRLTTLPPSCAIIMKSGNLNFLEPSGSLQACNGTALLYFVLCCRMSRVACMTAISVTFCCMGLEESEMRLGILLRKWLRKYANSLARSSVLMLQKVRYIGSDFVAVWTPESRELIIYTTYFDFWTLGILIRHFVLYDSYSKHLFSWTALFDCSLSWRHCVFC